MVRHVRCNRNPMNLKHPFLLATLGVSAAVAAPGFGQWRTNASDDDAYYYRNYDEWDQTVQDGPEDGAINAARQRLSDAVRRVRATWTADSNFIEMQDRLEKQQQALEVEKERVISAAMDRDPDYRELRQQVEKLDQEIERLPEPATQPGADGELPEVDPQRLAKAQEKLELQERLAEEDRRLVAADEKAAAAQEALDATQLELKKMQAELRKLLLNDPEFRAAQDALATARQNLQYVN